MDKPDTSSSPAPSDQSPVPVDSATTECSVLKCSLAGTDSWSTGEKHSEYVEWAVCRAHRALLRSGIEWATYSDLPHSSRQWIVMGTDLDDRNADMLRSATICIEYTGSGKEMRIGFSTAKAFFEVVLDQEQASSFRAALTEMAHGTAFTIGGEPR